MHSDRYFNNGITNYLVNFLDARIECSLIVEI